MGPPKPPTKVNEGEFEVVKRLGAGCFGEVWRGKSTKTQDEVAIKFEFRESKSAPQLFREVDTIKTLRDGGAPQGVVESFYFGKEGSFNCLVMEILGKSLEDQVQARKGKLTAKTTALIAEQVLQRIEFFHSKRFLHRDIKPENFMFGIKGKVHHVYIIDFGLSKFYWDANSNNHCPQKSGLSLTGTARYASINAHKGSEQSRRDDLEAIGHMFLYFLRGALPWSGLDAKTQEEKYRKICEKKETFPLPELCKGFPEAFQTYLSTCRGLMFSEKPNYDSLYQMLRSARPPGTEDHQYEWFDGQSPEQICPGGLVPIVPRTTQAQPDDAGAGGKKGGGTKSCCVIS
jgi:serine/threonine protein kinase